MYIVARTHARGHTTTAPPVSLTAAKSYLIITALEQETLQQVEHDHHTVWCWCLFRDSCLHNPCESRGSRHQHHEDSDSFSIVFHLVFPFEVK